MLAQYRIAWRAAALLLLGALAPGWTAEPAQPVRYHQHRFVIGLWVDPPADARMEERYKELAGAGFNTVLGMQAGTTATVARQLELCRKFGMQALVQTCGLPPEKLPQDPACIGYMLRDEPAVAAFPELARQIAAIRQARPGRLGYVNMFPNLANPRQLGVRTYDEYAGRFAAEMNVDVLCMDHYPQFRPDAPDGRDSYCQNLAVMRRISLERGIPYWNFFNIMPYGWQTDPTADQVRWQIYSTLTYGAKGVLYFCYYTPLTAEFPKGGAIIARDGRRTRHYEQARQLNAELKNLGPTLMQLTSTGVRRVSGGDARTTTIQDCPIRELSRAPEDPKPDLLIGSFRHADGRRAVMLQNYQFAYTAWPTVTFDAPSGSVLEVSKSDGQARPVVDDSPDMPGLQLSLDAGEGRLFLLPGK